MYICIIIMAIIWSHERKLEVKIIELYKLCRIVNDKLYGSRFSREMCDEEVSKFALYNFVVQGVTVL